MVRHDRAGPRIIEERYGFDGTIVGIDSAVPIFIGYTEKAAPGTGDLAAVQIGSLADFVDAFGGASLPAYYLAPCSAGPRDPHDLRIAEHFTLASGGDAVGLYVASGTRFNLYESLRLFYENGGGGCYVVSCGTYDAARVVLEDISGGLDAAALCVGPTMLVIPDAVLLRSKDDFAAITVAMLEQCRSLQDRVAILDVWGAGGEGVAVEELIADFRSGLAAAPRDSWRYGMTYFPFLVTSMTTADEIGLASFTRPCDLPALKAALGQAIALSTSGPGPKTDRAARLERLLDNLGQPPLDEGRDQAERRSDDVLATLSEREVAAALRTNIPAFADLCRRAARSRNILPASAAMAGLCALQDLVSGPWTPPPSRFRSVVKPAIVIDDADQEQLNHASGAGLAINAIRPVPGQDVLICGARTLDSDSEDWCDIRVSRACIYIEQSIRLALLKLAFAPNTAETWAAVASTIEDFLRGVWLAGGLIGREPEEAFAVLCGLGATMTAENVLSGTMIAVVSLRFGRDPTFLRVTFLQNMDAEA